MTRSGFISVVGRPNVGKSSLVNKMLGEKVSIVSRKPQTTRALVRGVLTRDDLQAVFVDTPGIHKPHSSFGEQLNDSARSSVDDVDVVVFVVDAAAGIGEGDQRVAKTLPKSSVCVVNKCDNVRTERIAEQLQIAGQWNFDEYFPVSARTGKGVDVLLESLLNRMPEGPFFYDADVVRDVSDAFWVAELVREQVLKHVEEELPHSIACEVTEWEWPRIRCEILVQRDSQKAIVLGKGGERLKKIGVAARAQLPADTYLDLFVKVEPNWPKRLSRLEQLGYAS
jgi:GTP-binding protein Era